MTNLPLSADAASVILGGGARLPSKTELAELNNGCTSIWTTHNGVPGRLFTSIANGKTLFIPAAGHYDRTTRNQKDTGCYCWSSSFVNETSCNDLYANASSVIAPNTNQRRLGLTIRPVLDPNI